MELKIELRKMDEYETGKLARIFLNACREYMKTEEGRRRYEEWKKKNSEGTKKA